MAKQKAKRPETKTVTLSTGARVTGSAELIDKMVRNDRGGKTAKRTAKPAVQTANEPPADTPPTEEEVARAAADAAGPEPTSTPTPERPSRGASLAAWADFAQNVGFEHPEGASRDEIRDAYEAEHPA